jgi:flagellar basal-body rod modification protein FlgD
MSVSSTSSVTMPTTPVYGTTGTTRIPKQTLGQEDFLKLITVQLSKQDPLKPMEDTSFMAQMAQFSALEQSSQMATDISGLRSELNLQSASNMIGREVSINTADGYVTGNVDSVETEGSNVYVGVNGLFYSLSNVVRVAPAAVATPSTT